METKPHEHVFAYKGLEYEVAERVRGDSRNAIPGYSIYKHFDVFFCQICLEERSVERHMGTTTGPVSGSTPHARKPKVREEPEETLAQASAS